jgi:PhoH-like ATPase
MSIFGIDATYSGIEAICGVSSRTVEKLHGGCLSIEVGDIEENWSPLENSFAVLKNGSSSALAIIQKQKLVHVRPTKAYGIEARNVEQVFAMDALLNPDIPLVTVTGVAGTGKTLLAIAAAIEKRKLYKKILIARPIMPMGRDLGSLPGSVSEKINPYMVPLFDNIAVIKEAGGSKAVSVIDNMFETEKILIEPLTFIRGRSIADSLFIIDEAQNLRLNELKTIITRASKGTKIILTGDMEQIDIPINQSGLPTLIERLKGQKLYAHVNLIESERSPLAKLAGELL